MNILALDTSAPSCSVAVWADGALAERSEVMDRGRGERLLPMILALLAEGAIGFRDFELVAVATGPGTYTGLRVGLAAARGVALAAEIPCLGVTSFESVLEAIGADGYACGGTLIALDSRRAEIYAQVFAAPDRPLFAPVIVAPEALPRLVPHDLGLVAGTAASAAHRALQQTGQWRNAALVPAHPRASAVATVAARKWRQGLRPDGLPDPLYLRSPDVG